MKAELDIVEAELVEPDTRQTVEVAVQEMEHDLVVYRMVEAEKARGGKFRWEWWWDSLPVAIRSGDVDTFRHLIGMGLKNGFA